MSEFFRSGSNLTSVRTYLLWTSLMARVFTLGPSVAPRSGESSTVHGAAFFWVESFYMVKFETLVFILSALVSEGFKTLELSSFPATMNPSPTFDSSQRSRQPSPISRICKRKLGLQRMGLFLCCGPLALVRPNFDLRESQIGLGETLTSLEMNLNGLGQLSHVQNLYPPFPPEKDFTFVYGQSLSPASHRSDHFSMCSQLFDWISRFIVLLDLGHQCSFESLILVRYCVQLSRILFASSSRLWSEELFDAKVINSTIPTSFRLGWDHYYRLKCFECYMPDCTFCDPKVTLILVAFSSSKLQFQLPQSTSSREPKLQSNASSPYLSDLERKRLKKNGIMTLSLMSGGYRRFFNLFSTFPLFTGIKQVRINNIKISIQDFKSLRKRGIMIPSPWSGDYRSFLKFIFPNPPDLRPAATHLIADEQLQLVLLVPARTSVMKPFSTSPRLLTVTTFSSIDSLVEDHSTNRDLTCARTLNSFGLKALMESLSFHLIYLVLALGNASFTYVLNYVIFESLSLVLGLI